MSRAALGEGAARHHGVDRRHSACARISYASRRRAHSWAAGGSMALLRPTRASSRPLNLAGETSGQGRGRIGQLVTDEEAVRLKVNFLRLSTHFGPMPSRPICATAAWALTDGKLDERPGGLRSPLAASLGEPAPDDLSHLFAPTTARSSLRKLSQRSTRFSTSLSTSTTKNLDGTGLGDPQSWGKVPPARS